MTNTPPTHIPQLDGWRGFAIVAVLVGHFAGPGFGWLGPFGVMLFFVLSGRLMCQLLFVKDVPLGTFFYRRFSRVLPTFWLFVLVMYLYAAYGQAASYRAPPTELASTLFFLRTYWTDGLTIVTRQWPIGHIWSLNVEEHSYLFLAAGALLCRYYNSKSLVALFLSASLLGALAFNLLYAVSPPSGASPWYMRTECAALGILAGATFWFMRQRYGAAWAARVPALLPVASVVLAALCVALYAHKDLDKTLAPLCLAFSVTFIDRFPVLVQRLLGLAPLRWFGVCSFSLYLWQQPFFVATLTENVARPFAFILAMLVGTISFCAFEDPVRRAINRRRDERNKAAQPPTPTQQVEA